MIQTDFEFRKKSIFKKRPAFKNLFEFLNVLQNSIFQEKNLCRDKIYLLNLD